MSRTKRNLLIVFSLILWTTWPIISVIIAGSIASAFNCDLHEGSAQPCEIYGHDYGAALYTMGVAGWLMLVTIPSGIIGLAIFAVVTLWKSIIRKRDEKQGAGY